MTDRVTLIATLAAQFREADGMAGTNHPHDEYLAEAVRLVRQAIEYERAEWGMKSKPLHPAEDDESPLSRVA